MFSKPHAETTKDPRFNVSPFYILLRAGFEPASCRQGYEKFKKNKNVDL